MKVYLATWLLEKTQGRELTKIGAQRRLVSYWHTKDKPFKEVQRYVRRGQGTDS